MALAAGIRFGPYEIQSPLGAGGMGEVYRALDTNLGRPVAIKVLPEAFAGDGDRLARLEREAKALAALNHPNIAQIYGLEKTAETSALVMELVEGPTLADLIERGAAASGRAGLPLDDALSIATQLADALEAAHDQGIVHRDLKPANIKVRDDGTVKVLDFGLAKVNDANAPNGPNASQSPTLSLAATQGGVILGTAGYMAPEQAKGKPADRRADIWAFGCVLYEMLSGRRAFAGEDETDTLACVLLKEPDWGTLPVGTPPALARLLRQCLEKDPRQRLPNIAIARYEIQESRVAAAPVAALRPSGRRRWLAWAAGFGIIAAAAIGFTAASVLDEPASSPVTRFTVGPPADSALRGWRERRV